MNFIVGAIAGAFVTVLMYEFSVHTKLVAFIKSLIKKKDSTKPVESEKK